MSDESSGAGSPRDPVADAVPGRRRRVRHPQRVAIVIATIGVVLTGTASWAADRTDHKTEHNLLVGQTRQAALVLTTAIQVIQQPLASALSVQRAAGMTGDAGAFAQLMAPNVGDGKVFEDAALWRKSGNQVIRVRSVGKQPAMAPDAPETRTYLLRAFTKSTPTVRFVTVGGRSHVAWAQADPATGFVVYAETILPANRRAPVDRDSAFSSLHYAIYLGSKISDDTLSTTDVDPDSLPLTGDTARQEVAFGDNALTLVTKARTHLGASLGARLPWYLLVGGLLVTIGATWLGEQLARGRGEVEALYGQQRDLFVRLQRALLPHANPVIPNLEIAADYVAGAYGLDIGGDWYSIVGVGDDRYAFVVGDVSGRGVDAVAVMAHARFTLRAYLLDGDSPCEALEKASHQFDLAVDEHMTTALVGVGNARTGEVTMANAGHPPPALVGAEGVSFVDLPPGRPLGTGPCTYQPRTITLPVGSTLVGYTDGLVERRGEDIDAGLARLAGVLTEAASLPVEELVDHTVRTLRHEDAPDDIAVLALRRVGER